MSFYGLTTHDNEKKRNREISKKRNNFETITVLVVPFENYFSGRAQKHQTSHFTVYQTRLTTFCRHFILIGSIVIWDGGLQKFSFLSIWQSHTHTRLMIQSNSSNFRQIENKSFIELKAANDVICREYVTSVSYEAKLPVHENLRYSEEIWKYNYHVTFRFNLASILQSIWCNLPSQHRK